MFLLWQCRVRQEAMREHGGRPNDGMIPHVFIPGEEDALCRMITVLCRRDQFSVTPELAHIARSTSDPAQRLEKAVRFFSSAYFQRAGEFSDVITATFARGSSTSGLLLKAAVCRLVFDAFSQRFDLTCTVRRLTSDDSLHAATYWHNLLFNSRLDPEAEILAFVPIWDDSSAVKNFTGKRDGFSA